MLDPEVAETGRWSQSCQQAEGNDSNFAPIFLPAAFPKGNTETKKENKEAEKQNHS